MVMTEYRIIAKDDKRFSIERVDVEDGIAYTLSYNESFPDRESAEQFAIEARANFGTELDDDL